MSFKLIIPDPSLSYTHHSDSFVHHGWVGTSTYGRWAGMVQRCTNPKNKCFYLYGGRGITIHQEWLKFPQFLKDMGECPEGMQLERINNNGSYCPTNCKWDTPANQARNRRTTTKYTFNGQTLCVRDWSNVTGIPYSTLINRLNVNKWDIETALTRESNPISRALITKMESR